MATAVYLMTDFNVYCISPCYCLLFVYIFSDIYLLVVLAARPQQHLRKHTHI